MINKITITLILTITTLLAHSQCNLNPFAGNDTLICSLSTNINGVLTDNNNTCEWSSNNPDITFTAPNNTNTNIYVDTCGTYEIYFTEIESSTCSVTDTVVICFREIVPATITHETISDTICNALDYSTNMPPQPPPNIQCDCIGNDFYDSLQSMLDSLLAISPLVSAHWDWTGPANASVIFEYDSTTYSPFSVTVSELGNYHFFWTHEIRDSLTEQLIDSVEALMCLQPSDFIIYDIDLLFYDFNLYIAVQDIPCYENCTGEYHVITINGIPPFNYISGTSDAMGLCPGPYNIIVVDDFGCIANANAMVNEQPPPILNISSTDISCFGDNNGSATVNVSSPYFYTINWSNNEHTNTISQLSQGNYTVTVIDDFGCIAIENTIINEALPIIVDKTYNDETCYNTCDGDASINISGGNQPYTISWSNSETTESISNLCAGNYFYTITDVNGCTFTDSVNIEGADSIVFSSNFTQNICAGQCDGNIEISSANLSSYSFNWSNGESTPSIIGLCSGNYTVTISDGNCNISQDFEINEYPSVEFNIPNQVELCENAEQEIIIQTSNGTAPFQFLVNNLNSTNNFTIHGTDSIFTIQIIDANNCSSETQNLTITNPDALSISIFADQDTVCSSTQVLINADINSGNIEDIYNGNNNIIQFPYSTTIYNDTILTFTATDACNESITTSIPIYTYVEPNVLITSDKLSGCSPLIVNFNSSNNGIWEINNISQTQGVSFNYTFSTPGFYNISQTVGINNKCYYEYSLNTQIEVYSNPIADFDYDATTISENEINTVLTNKSLNSDHYIWNFYDGSNSTEVNPEHSFFDTDNITIELIAFTNHECVDTIIKTIETEDGYTIFLPNTFTPGTNGENGIFKPYYTGISKENFHMYIYDRWGEIIWESTDIELGWDGRAKDGEEIVENYLYTWLISFYDLKGGKHEEVGVVLIYR